MNPATLLPHQRAGAGVPLVLVHGYLGGSQQWAQEINHFSAHFDVIAPALPGFAEASELHACNRIGDMADAVIGLLDDLQVTEFILLGHSMGGMIAQALSIGHPGRVRTLTSDVAGQPPVGFGVARFLGPGQQCPSPPRIRHDIHAPQQDQAKEAGRAQSCAGD